MPLTLSKPEFKLESENLTADSALLILEDGTIFKGKSIGAKGTTYGELVFNTALTGYQEILSDPSYTGQIVLMTYPEIGNYGINSSDVESKTGLHAAGLVVRQLSDLDSSWRSESTLQSHLEQHGIIGISDIDTRALTRKIRAIGAPKTAITTEFSKLDEIKKSITQLPDFAEQDFVFQVSTQTPYVINSGSSQAKLKRLTVLDFGIKQSILDQLNPYAESITVLPAISDFDAVLGTEPEAIFLSNGPGDPNALTGVVSLVQQLLETNIPLVGICLGHQLLGLANGAKVVKMPFGHHGGNHPVKDIEADRIMITSQNHSYAVDTINFPTESLCVTHINLNDQTIEGFKHISKPVFSVQFHPEAGPGPHDARNWFGTTFNQI